MASNYAFHLVESKSSLMARIYGVFSLKLPNINKVYFIVMHSLDFCQDQKVVFRYDLKFSEVNRTHINTEQDLAFIQEYLVNKDSAYMELINQSVGSQSFLKFRNGTTMSKNNSQGSRSAQEERNMSTYSDNSEVPSQAIGN